MLQAALFVAALQALTADNHVQLHPVALKSGTLWPAHMHTVLPTTAATFLLQFTHPLQVQKVSEHLAKAFQVRAAGWCGLVCAPPCCGPAAPLLTPPAWHSCKLSFSTATNALCPLPVPHALPPPLPCRRSAM